MKLRPCIDIHSGKVKQIVGGSLKDNSEVKQNFVSDYDGGFYGRLYRQYGLGGGHIILLDRFGTTEYAKDVKQAELALKEFPGGLQLGGGVNLENAANFLDMGASHVIVTSLVFKNGEIDYSMLDKLVRRVGKKHLVLDLSCRKTEDGYFICTDRWQKLTKVKLSYETMCEFAEKCDEFLVHAADVEGKVSGIEKGVAEILKDCPIKCTYAGGISSEEDIITLERVGGGNLDFTIGSALDIFGGKLCFEKLAKKYN